MHLGSASSRIRQAAKQHKPGLLITTNSPGLALQHQCLHRGAIKMPLSFLDRTVTGQWESPTIKTLVQSQGLRLDGVRFCAPSAVLYLQLPSSSSQPCSRDAPGIREVLNTILA